MTSKKKIKNYSTEYSHVVPHHSTDSAIDCLTSQIGRDAVGLVVYGRSSKVINFFGLLTCLPLPSVIHSLSLSNFQIRTKSHDREVNVGAFGL